MSLPGWYPPGAGVKLADVCLRSESSRPPRRSPCQPGTPGSPAGYRAPGRKRIFTCALALMCLTGPGGHAAWSQTAATQASRTADLMRQRAAAAQEAANAAERAARSGTSTPLFLRERVATRCRIIAAHRGLLEAGPMKELLRGEIKYLRDLEREYEQRNEKSPGASPLDALEIRYARLGLELELAGVLSSSIVPPTPSPAQPEQSPVAAAGEGRGGSRPSQAAQTSQAAKVTSVAGDAGPAGLTGEAASERIRTAQQAYRMLEQKMGGRFDPASFSGLWLWSRRLMESQLAAASDDRSRLEILEAYLERSRALEAVFQKRKDTDIYARNLAAAEAQRLEAESLIAQLQGRPDRARERLEKRARDLHLVHKALVLADQAPDFGRFVETRAECFAAESAFLRAAGRTGLLARCRFDYVRDMQDWEELTRARVRKRRDPKLELDLATARYARITAELAMELRPDQQ